jgi:catechol 2,3-dioxygenase-like lactoylglutathione lyase family enzyme
MTRTVRHVGIVVKKIEEILPFYRDLLGLKLVKKSDEPTRFINPLLNLTGCQLITVKLSADEGTTLIELLEFTSYPDNPSPLPDLIRPGISHIAFTVKDLDLLYKKLTQVGIVFISPPLKSPDGHAKVAFCKDPAGNYLELVEEMV